MLTDADKAKHGSGEFEGAGGIRLHERWWRREGEPRAAIAVVRRCDPVAKRTRKHGKVKI